jgi:hypothetical protein
MATDNVLVIVTSGTSPNSYNTAHECTAGDPVIVTAPPGGCSIQFSCAITSTSPVITPSSNQVYSLTGNQVVEFVLDVHPTIGYSDASFYVGPYGVDSATATVPDPGLNASAHTVRVGSTGGKP